MHKAVIVCIVFLDLVNAANCHKATIATVYDMIWHENSLLLTYEH